MRRWQNFVLARFCPVAILNLQLDDIISIISAHVMAEEFQKYKNILDREKEEFRWQLEREVSTFLVLLE